MFTQFSAAVAEDRRRQLVAEASKARLAREARAAKPHVRRQRRFGATLLEPVFDVTTAHPAYQG